MQKRLLGALVGIALLMTLCVNVLAGYVNESTTNTSGDILTVENQEAPEDISSLLDTACSTVSVVGLAENSEQPASGSSLIVNGVTIEDETITQVNDTTYISIRTIIEALFPTAQVTWQSGQLVASGDGFHLTAKPGNLYVVVNDRYLYVPNGILYQNESTMAPIRTVCNALGASTQWEVMTKKITVTTTGTPLDSASSYYNSNELYWMSRIISAESKNQPLKGKIAVGTVIMNRVESSKFPNSIYNVIFSGHQFTPVLNGSIYSEPTAESVLAAKLVLDGAREAGGSLFFHRAGLNSWAARNKTFITTIADHSFYQ